MQLVTMYICTKIYKEDIFCMLFVHLDKFKDNKELKTNVNGVFFYDVL